MTPTEREEFEAARTDVEMFRAWHARKASCCEQCRDRCEHYPWEQAAYCAGVADTIRSERIAAAVEVANASVAACMSLEPSDEWMLFHEAVTRYRKATGR